MTHVNTKHTPGPWAVGLSVGSAHVSPEGPWGWYETDIEGPVSEGCFLSLRQYHGGEVGQANARLIAAAPDLLEACRVAVEVIEDRSEQEVEDAGLDGIRRRLRAAISKADGREVAP